MPNRKSAKDATDPKLLDFKSWEARLLNAYKKSLVKTRDSETKTRPRKRASNVFKLYAYRYYNDLMKAGEIDKLRQYVEQRDGNKWKGHGNKSEQWIVRLVSNYEQTNNRIKRRSRITAEMRLARINKVRPDVLLGFLHEAGSINMIEKAAASNKVFAWASAYQ